MTLASLIQDCRYALRTLPLRPGFAAIAVVTLAVIPGGGEGCGVRCVWLAAKRSGRHVPRPSLISTQLQLTPSSGVYALPAEPVPTNLPVGRLLAPDFLTGNPRSPALRE